MRLNPGISLSYADDALRRAQNQWENARSSHDRYRAYTDAVGDTYRMLTHVFAEPDFGASMHSTAYWNLLAIGRAPSIEARVEPLNPLGQRALRAENLALANEIDNQVHALTGARSELDALMALAALPGAPVVYDTNMLNHWAQPGDIAWREVLRDQGEEAAGVRLVVPLRVVDELDRQKYGAPDRDLARKAATAIRYLERTLKDSQPGQPVQVRPKVTLEVWGGIEDRGGDADLAILRCAADLDNLVHDGSVRVLTADMGMRLRARQMSLKVLELPSRYRKPGTAITEMPEKDETAG
jgi:hypothetical protein